MGMRVIVVGGGPGGLGAALALGRDGHDVVVLERDASPMPESPDDAFVEWDRRGAPQVRHSHAFLARIRNLLRDRYPDVLESLSEVGVTELAMTDPLPPTIEDTTPHEGDEDLVILASRRTTFEWVVRRAAMAEPNVQFRDGVGVAGLLADGKRITGVRTESGEELAADAVVVAGGRRTALPEWLAAVGLGPVPEEVEDCGIVYFSRFYKLLPGAETPPRTGPAGGDLGYLKYGVFYGDRGTFSITLSCATEDSELRKLMMDPEVFQRAAMLLTATAPWVAPDRAEPTSEVHAMAGLLNRLRSYVVDGEPLALGLHAIGDARLCTNPLYGRGCSTSFWMADLLAQVLREHPDDQREQALRFDALVQEHVVPWYRDSVRQDGVARTVSERILAGLPPDGDPDDPQTMIRSVVREGLLPAVRTDPVVYRAFMRTLNLLSSPDAMMSDPDVMGRVMTVWQDRANRPPEPVLGPSRREDLVDALR
jgi:2-polyprenyl-6-methoxyphenol hydroxylase-like FAD-dependent oxidoreductase